MSRRDQPQVSWMFRFGLERVDGAPFGAEVAEELLDVITAWAEARDLQVGGGFVPPDDD